MKPFFLPPFSRCFPFSGDPCHASPSVTASLPGCSQPAGPAGQLQQAQQALFHFPARAGGQIVLLPGQHSLFLLLLEMGGLRCLWGPGPGHRADPWLWKHREPWLWLLGRKCLTQAGAASWGTQTERFQSAAPGLGLWLTNAAESLVQMC